MSTILIIPEETRARVADYLLTLRTGDATLGKYLADALGEDKVTILTTDIFLNLLINTKIPQIFAESAMAGDGSDWNLTELASSGIYPCLCP